MTNARHSRETSYRDTREPNLRPAYDAGIVQTARTKFATSNPATSIDPPPAYWDMNVLEIYLASGQGEGMWSGQPSTFVRLAGCTVGCKFCDTKYSWRAGKGNWMSPEQVVLAVEEKSMGWPDVVLTGGEPLEHPLDQVWELLNLLTGLRKIITIETSGLYIPHIDAPHHNWNLLDILWSVAPKLSTAEATVAAEPQLLVNWLMAVDPSFGRRRLQFKFVIDSDAGMQEVEDLLLPLADDPTVMRMVADNFMLILQPTTPYLPAPIEEVRSVVLERCETLQDRLLSSPIFRTLATVGIRTVVRPQMHALIFGQKRLV